MRALIMLLAGALAAGAVACGERTEDEIQDAEAVESPERPAPVPAIPPADDPVRTVRFEAVDGHVTGLVRLYTAAEAGAGADTGAAEPASGAGPASGFRLEVTLDGLTEGAHAWHIHEGSCDAQGPVVVAMTPMGEMEGIAAPLTVPAEGAPVRGAATVTGLTLQQLEESDYSLRVHEGSGTQPGPVAACADLSGDDNATI